MKKIDIEDVKKIELDILIQFDKICKENKLRYSLFAGTLIGAVRHKGFIPWDDDIDVMMPREDYEKFIRLSITGNYEIRVPGDGYYYPFAKMIRKDTLLIEEGRTEKLGVYIDIFPIDKYNKAFENKIVNKAKRKLKLLQLLTCRTKTNIFPRKQCRTIIRTILKLYYSNKKIVKLIQKFNDYLINSSKNGNYDCFLAWCDNADRNMYGIDIFDSIETMKFENQDFCVISKYDFILTKIYGNYMELPPVECRVPKHDFEAFYL